MRRTVLCLLLAVVLVIPSFVSCGEGEVPDPSVTSGEGEDSTSATVKTSEEDNSSETSDAVSPPTTKEIPVVGETVVLNRETLSSGIRLYYVDAESGNEYILHIYELEPDISLKVELVVYGLSVGGIEGFFSHVTEGISAKVLGTFAFGGIDFVMLNNSLSSYLREEPEQTIEDLPENMETVQFYIPHFEYGTFLGDYGNGRSEGMEKAIQRIEDLVFDKHDVDSLMDFDRSRVSPNDGL